MAKEMRDSGIDIIGIIPDDWDNIRLKYLADIETGSQDTQDAIEDGEYPFFVRSPIIERINRYVFDGEAILMAGDGVGAGKVFHYVNEKFGCHQRVYIIHSFKNILGKYLFYYMQNLFSVEIDKGSAKSTVDSVRLPMLQGFTVCMPPVVEQKKIAGYLDIKCVEIDALSSEIQSQIDILEDYKKSVITETVARGLNPDVKMKASRIAWISIVPAHWNFSKIKYEIFPLQRPVRPDALVMTCFRDGEVTLRQNRREDGFTISFTENGYQGVEVGDLVIHGMDAFAGAIGCSDSRGKITPVVHVCKTTGNNRFFMYVLRSMAMNGVFMDYAEGIRVRSSDFRNFNKLGKFPIVVPPISEQNKIVSYLDNRCEKIDAIIAQKKEQLSVMADYKKSLIYEYVTGKREVPDNDEF